MRGDCGGADEDVDVGSVAGAVEERKVSLFHVESEREVGGTVSSHLLHGTKPTNKDTIVCRR